MSQRLNSFISSIRGAESVEQEKSLIATEQAHIRAYIRNIDPEMRPRVVSKLVFLDTIGQNTAWGQMEAITLMTHERFSHKRIGYVCAAVLLDQTNDLTVLVTHTLLRDLGCADMNVKALALSFIANLGSPEVCRAVASEVKKLLSDSSKMLMKKAGMATLRIVRMNPDLCDIYKNAVQQLLNSNSHAVVISGMNLVIAMLEIDPSLANAWSKFTAPFTRILKSLVSARATREYSHSGFSDPYMQIKALRALTLLGGQADELDGVLQTMLGSTVPRKNAGRAILYQAAETIVALSKKASLRALAFSQVGRMLGMRDANVLYSALSVFARALYSERLIDDRKGVDSAALQRFRGYVVKCLNHRDPSLRRRALDVISALIDETNAEELVPEIITYLKLAEPEFRPEMVAKVYTATQRFAKDPQWNFDAVHQLLIDSGNYVSMDVISSFCELIAKTPLLQPHAVSCMSESLVNFSQNQTLVQVAAYVVGEFATVSDTASQSLRSIVLMPQTKPETVGYIVTALAKLAVRFNDVEQTIETLQKLSRSNDLEVQQRAGEMMKLLGRTEMRAEMLAPLASAVEQNPIAIVEAPRAQPDDDILLLVLDNAQASASQAVSSGDLLGDLGFGLESPPVTAMVQESIPTTAPVQSAIELMRTEDLMVSGRTQKNPQDPRQIALQLMFHATSALPITDFVTEYAVAPGWQLNTQPADGKCLSQPGGRPVTQLLYLRSVTSAPFQMHVRTRFKTGAQPLTQTGVIRVLPT